MLFHSPHGWILLCIFQKLNGNICLKINRRIAALSHNRMKASKNEMSVYPIDRTTEATIRKSLTPFLKNYRKGNLLSYPPVMRQCLNRTVINTNRTQAEESSQSTRAISLARSRNLRSKLTVESGRSERPGRSFRSQRSLWSIHLNSIRSPTQNGYWTRRPVSPFRAHRRSGLLSLLWISCTHRRPIQKC